MATAVAKKNETQVELFETVQLGTSPVDRDAGVIRDVKVLGFTSQNNRRYTPTCLEKAVKLYEGARVNVDHGPKGLNAPERGVNDRGGVIRGVRFDPQTGLRGDYHYLKSNPISERVCEDAERGLGAFGFSHNALGKTSIQNGETIVEQITKVRSVDLVSDPATNASLFESVQPLSEDADSLAWSIGYEFANEVRNVFCDPKLKPAQKKARLAELVDQHEQTKSVVKPVTESQDMAAASTETPITESQADDKASATAAPAAAPAPKVEPLTESKAPAADVISRVELTEAVGYFGQHSVSVDAELLEDCLQLPRERRASFVERIAKLRAPAAPAPAAPVAPPGPIFGARSQEPAPQTLTEGTQTERPKLSIDPKNPLELTAFLRGALN